MMSVHYTATWYDVTQARQQDTHHTYRHVPARPAGLQFSHSHSIAVTGSREGQCMQCILLYWPALFTLPYRHGRH